ncbi:MAG: GTP-binding protein [Gemmatimonadaceae bacterium]
MPRLPLTIVGGDAGAGKTTLLGQLQGQEHVVGVATLLDVGDLSADLAELRPRLDASAHVLIEARGDSSLRRVAGYGYMPGYRLDGIIVVMNARDIHDRLPDGALRGHMTTHLRDADILIINKLDVVESGKRTLHHAWLDDELPRLRVIETCQGKVAGSLLLGVSPDVARQDARAVPGNWETTYRPPRRNRLMRRTEPEEPRCRVWSIQTPEPIAAQRFRTWISLLPRTVVRGRGDVLIEEDPQLRYQFNMIGHRWHLQRERPWGSTAPETQLTLVGM